MGAETLVEWTKYTLSFWLGCLKVSPECEHCYAETDTPVRVVNSKLRPAGLRLWGPAPKAVRHVTSDGTWAHALAWNKTARASGRRDTVFCNADSDFFEDFAGQIWRPDGAGGEKLRMGWSLSLVRRDALAVMAVCDALEWLVLTKRPENVRRMVPPEWLEPGRWPRHIRIGTTAGTAKSAAERTPHLLAGPWPNFVSAEPLLEPVDFRSWLPTADHRARGEFARLTGLVDLGTRAIDWLIVGGESGPKARPCDLAWVRQVIKQCRAAQVPVFVKQLGTRPAFSWESDDPDGFDKFKQWQEDRERLKHKKGGDPAEWPADLRVREFPEEASRG